MPYKAKLVTRSTDTSSVTEDTLNKGSALTHGELDSDLINLRDQSIGIASDDSTVIDVQMGNTLTIAGGAGISTTVAGQTVTIAADGTLTIVGDDSTGTAITIGETFKIAGATGITTAVSGDTLTITGPSLASFITASSTDTLTNKTFNANGTGNSITNIEVADLAAGVLDTDLSTVSASDDTLPSAKAVKSYIDAQNTAQAITFVGDDSTGTAINSGETVKIAGGTGITTAMSGDILTITASGSASTGDLSITGTTISAETTNADITITSSGTGNLNVDMDTLRIGDSNANATITTNGTGDLILNTNAGTNSGTITIEDAANGRIIATPNGTGYVNLGYGDLKASLRQNNTLVPNNVMVDHGANRVWSQTQDLSTMTANTDRIYANNDLLSVQLTGSGTSDSDHRIRQISITELDLNGINFVYDQTGYKEAVSGRKGVVELINQSASAATMTQVQGVNGTASIGSTNATAQAGDITITDAIGMSGAVDIIAGTGRTTTATNAYGQYAFLTTSGVGTKNITNWYALYAATTSATATNKYGVYVADATFNNYIGGLNFSNGAISTADSTAIQIDEGVNISGALTAEGSTTFNSFYRDKINALTYSTTITVNANLAPTHKVTLTGNTAFVITNLPTGGNLTLIIVQDGTGSRTATFGTDTSTAVKFAGGSATLSTALNSIDIVNIYNDGTNYYGSLAKAFA